MSKEKIWLSSPHMGGNEQKYINDAFAENWIAPLGPNVTEFEKSIKTYLYSQKLGEQEVAALSSGTAALHLALILLGVTRDDEVLCQSMTFAASANPIIYQGAKPVFIDSESKTLNICPEQLEIAIKDRISKGKKPKAIIAVHLYGMPYNVDAVQKVAEEYDIPVIEDSAEALGSSYKGVKCGTFGRFSVLSFNGNKIITTSGGGALVTRNSEDKNKAIYLATQARDDAPHYQHSEIGYNYRLSNICAGIGRGQMEVLDKRVLARRDMFQFYVNLFKDIDGIKVHEEPGEEYYSNHWLSVIEIDEKKVGLNREKLRKHLLTEEIESRPLWKPMHMQPVFRNYPFYGTQVAENKFNTGLCLPSGSNLTDSDRSRIEKAIMNGLKK
ncbi:aminotransferase class I/II-fold pyridoxal phosphate-dependent enzyme [Gramella sp. BOM4]|nr:aminotransferase class I/II-fold pyridoxal phosphate-dependent enzyme [Christiangramia bathymodioli]